MCCQGHSWLTSLHFRMFLEYTLCLKHNSPSDLVLYVLNLFSERFLSFELLILSPFRCDIFSFTNSCIYKYIVYFTLCLSCIMKQFNLKQCFYLDKYTPKQIYKIFVFFFLFLFLFVVAILYSNRLCGL